MFTQDRLRAELAGRIAAAGPPEQDVTAIAVLRRFDPALFARSVLDYTRGLTPEQGRAWLRAFTRTVFLVGNPAHLVARFEFDHVSAGGDLAWRAPGSAEASTGLRRMLKLFDGTAPLTLPGEVPVAAGERRRHLHVATAGLTVANYLVHVNHTLAEAVLDGLLAPGDGLALHHAPDLPDLPDSVALRVHRDTADPELLRAYAALV